MHISMLVNLELRQLWSGFSPLLVLPSGFLPCHLNALVKASVVDPDAGSGAFLTPES